VIIRYEIKMNANVSKMAKETVDKTPYGRADTWTQIPVVVVVCVLAAMSEIC
jgi:hypothetical protein